MSLPQFIIAGERRSGTTSLAKWMETHPEIYLHPKMDMAHFVASRLKSREEPADISIDGDEWWESHSAKDYAALLTDASSSAKSIGEKSADYVHWQPAHERMKAIVPNAKIIVTLRHPVERCWSMYWNEVGKGREPLAFEDALAKEEQRLNGSPYQSFHFSYVRRGYYAKSLKQFFKTFGPTQVKIVIFEELLRDPSRVMSDVHGFLGVTASLGTTEHKQFNNNWTTVPSTRALNCTFSKE